MTLAILAGGKSSRMDYQNKAFLQYKDKTFIEHIIESGNQFSEIIIVTNTPKDYLDFGLKLICDEFVDCGPLGGIHTALKHSNTEKIVCVACDMPLVSEEMLNHLRTYEGQYDVLVPMFENRLQPLCAVYSKGLIPKIENHLLNEEYKLQNLIKKVNTCVLTQINGTPFQLDDFLNINTPAELAALKER